MTTLMPSGDTVAAPLSSASASEPTPLDTDDSHANAYLAPTSSSTKPHALTDFSTIAQTLHGQSTAVFLDYDGTLTPIVSDPNAAQVNSSTKEVIARVAQLYPTAIVTGRKMEKIQEFLMLPSLYYAGSHGFDIRAPGNQVLKRVADEYLPLLQQVRDQIRTQLKQREIQGSLVEDNTYSISVHYRNVPSESDAKVVHEVVKEAATPHSDKLQILPGKMVWEVRPLLNWHKGQAVQHLLSVMHPNSTLQSLAPVCLGDDTTDEDAFRELEALEHSVTVLVLADDSVQRLTNAKYVCRQDQVEEFLRKLSHL